LNRTIKYRAIFLLLAFIAYLVSGPALNGLSYYGSGSGAGTGQKWITKCQKAAHIHHKSSTTSKQNTISKKDGTQKQGTPKIIPCNPSLQLLPVSETLFPVPDSRSHSIAIRNQKLPSQLFVFREPHPPQFRA
jgi:hypothetical protein